MKTKSAAAASFLEHARFCARMARHYNPARWAGVESAKEFHTADRNARMAYRTALNNAHRRLQCLSGKHFIEYDRAHCACLKEWR